MSSLYPLFKVRVIGVEGKCLWLGTERCRDGG